MAIATINFKRIGSDEVKSIDIESIGGQDDLEANDFDGATARYKTAEAFFWERKKQTDVKLFEICRVSFTENSDVDGSTLRIAK